MLKKLAVLFLVLVFVLQTMAPAAVVANEYEVEDAAMTEYEEEVSVDEEIANEEVSVDEEITDEEVSVDEETTDEEVSVDEEIELDTMDEVEVDAEVFATPAALVAGWTPEQVADFDALVAENNALWDSIILLVDAAVAIIEDVNTPVDLRDSLDALVVVYVELELEFWAIMDAVDEDSITFEDAMARLVANTNSFTALSADLESALSEQPGDDNGAETIDWAQRFFDLQLESIETVTYVGDYFLELWNYLLESHLFNTAAFDAYWDLWYEFVALNDAAVQIGLDVAAGILTPEEGYRLLRANIDARLAFISLIQAFDPNNLDGGNNAGSGNNAGGGNDIVVENNVVAENNADVENQILPQTGVATTTALAGVAVIGIGAIAAIAKNKRK